MPRVDRETELAHSTSNALREVYIICRCIPWWPYSDRRHRTAQPSGLAITRFPAGIHDRPLHGAREGKRAQDNAEQRACMSAGTRVRADNKLRCKNDKEVGSARVSTPAGGPDAPRSKERTSPRCRRPCPTR
eukprot:6190731-Pleurochrysis_carterae.AAC.1